jgi:hypothetical protein
MDDPYRHGVSHRCVGEGQKAGVPQDDARTQSDLGTSEHGWCDVNADHGSTEDREAEGDNPGSHSDIQYRPITVGQATVEFGGKVVAPLLTAPGGVIAPGHIVVDGHGHEDSTTSDGALVRDSGWNASWASASDTDRSRRSGMSPSGRASDASEQGECTDGGVRSFGMLLGPADLPGRGWEISEERHWPTGELDPTSEKSQRALQAGGVTAWRSLTQAEAMRAAWVEVVPYATTDDAVLSLRQVPRFFVGAQRPDETIVSERSVDDQRIVGVPDTWVYEKSMTDATGPSLSRYVGGAIDRVLFLTCCSGRQAFWSWPDVMDAAERQAERVRKVLGAAGGSELTQ